MERNTSKVVSGPLDRDMSTLEMAEGKPNGSAEAASSTGPDMPKSTARTATDDMSKSTSKEASSWRRRLPQHSFTMLPNARAEPRPFINKYFFKRPRLLQYYDGGALVDSHGNRLGPTNPTDLIPSRSAATEGSASSVPAQLVDESHAPETSKIQRDWLNLFIDLLWVGIVSNISSSFVSAAFEPASSWGYAFLEFAVLFITAFRFWSYIRKFLNNFFNKDFTQSLFLTWVLVLALFFGNQTPYFLDPVGGEVIIATFLTAKGSFILVEALYCIFIPSMRREFLLTFLISIPVAALWGASVAVEWPARAALILPAVLFEGVVSAIIALPLGDWFLHGAPKKALDPDNFVERLQGFFIIVLGEGVYALISGDNWGVGLSAQMVFAIESLIVYYSLFWLFFMGDQTKTYIHAIYRNRYTSLAFQLFHVLLFASILLLDASIKYLIQNSLPSTDGPEVLPDPGKTHSLLLARWTISASLGATLLFMTLKALLNRSLDRPGTLLVNNRYLRMAPRAVVCIVAICLPAVNEINTVTFLGSLVGLLQTLAWWEVMAAMESGAKWFEPKES